MSSIITDATLRRMEKIAQAAAAKSYSPYSKFPVGAAVLAANGKIYGGCNVENASYGLTHCAERTAICTAVTAGERHLRAVVIYTPTPTPTLPCGACRQFINEFAPHATIISTCASKLRNETSLTALLPDAFGPAHLTTPARHHR